jgi:hypothetical protein
MQEKEPGYCMDWPTLLGSLQRANLVVECSARLCARTIALVQAPAGHLSTGMFREAESYCHVLMTW